MVDTQVKDENELVDFDGDEVCYFVDDPTGTPANKKVQLKNHGFHFNSPRRRFYAFCDFLQNSTTSAGAGGTDSWIVATGGTGATIAAIDVGSLNALGIISLGIGTLSGSRSFACASGAGCIKLGSGRARFQAKAAIHIVSDGTDTYTARMGFMDVFTAEPTDGCYFRYTHGTNSGKWQAVTRSNGTETATDTGVTAVADTWGRFSIDVNAAGTSVAFSIDGAVVATNTTNIPTGAGRESTYGLGVVKTSAGTTNNAALYIDYAEVEYLFTTVR